MLERGGRASSFPSAFLGTTRIRVKATNPAQAVFVGIAPTGSVDAYLAGVSYATVQRIGGTRTTYVEHAGTAPAASPGQQGFWASSVSGAGSQTLTWTPASGDWTIVVMNQDAVGGVTVQADIAATVPSLTRIEFVMFVTGVVLLAIGVLMVTAPIRAASRDHGMSDSEPHPSVN